jgi:hypothetical protein
MRSARAGSPPVHPSIGDPAFHAVRCPRVSGRVLTTVPLAAFLATPFLVEIGTAPRATALLGEQRVERRDRIDLTTTRPTRELRHAS